MDYYEEYEKLELFIDGLSDNDLKGLLYEELPLSIDFEYINKNLLLNNNYASDIEKSKYHISNLENDIVTLIKKFEEL
jgi:hypothetical protein